MAKQPKPNKDNVPVVPFATQALWEQWLAQHHAAAHGIWIQFFKKASGMATVTYAEALDVALCYGWIDGQLKPMDAVSYKQYFTPRRPRSIWSKRNVAHVARLMAEGRMQPAGIAQVEAAKTDGRWEAAYDSPANLSVPDDFMAELTKHPGALAFYASLSRTNKYAISWRLQTAKRPETREKRKQEILEMLRNAQKFH